MVTNDNKKNFDMLDYIGKGKSMYDILDRYLDGYLQGDYSDISLINHSRTFGDDFPSMFSFAQKNNAYQPALIKLMLNLRESINPKDELADGVKKVLSEEEKKELLERIRAIDSSKSISSIEQAMKLLEKNNFKEPYYDDIEFYSKLNEVIVEAALGVSTDESVMKVKQTLLKFVLLPPVSNMLKAKYPNRYSEYTPEWEEFDFINKTLTDIQKLTKYDEFLQRHDREVKAMEEKNAVELSCKAKRERYVIQALVEGMTDEEIEKVSKCKTLEEVIFEKPDQIPLREGSYSWQISKYPQPVLLLDKMAEYSPNGKENQRVIALSYGRFEYETLFNKERRAALAADNLELVGITRIGVDGSKSYFVLAPTMQVSLERIYDVPQRDMNIFGAVGGIGEDYSSQRLTLVREGRIPKELEEFYATVAFSNECLEAAVNNNFRYVGEVSTLGGKPRLTASYRSNAQDMEAACYASKHSGRVGDKVYGSLERYCGMPELLCEHFDAINRLPERIISRQIEYINLSGVKEIADFVNRNRRIFGNGANDLATTKKPKTQDSLEEGMAR